MIDSNKPYTCVIIDAEDGEDFQDYVYWNGKAVPHGEQVGVEITQDGNTEFFLLEDILFRDDS